MKIAKTLVVLSVFCLAGTFTSCSGNKEAEVKEEVVAETWACPMDCEDGKTYTEVGQCPVCGMDLEKVEK
ncbi:MAG: hypothetical protein H3C31_08855 [Brumimicrobium sp.]|nr:hypothetical protein [Brumimicrobium sp.]MCO5269291.1 hypothetical protein [Brumimicrobium sp.]